MTTNHNTEETVVVDYSTMGLGELQTKADELFYDFVEGKAPRTKEQEKALKAEYALVAAAANKLAGKEVVQTQLKMPKKIRTSKAGMHLSAEPPATNKKKAKLSKAEKQAALKTSEAPKKKADKKAPAKKAAAPAKKAAAATKKAAAKKGAATTTERRAILNETEIAAIIKLIQKGTPYKQIKADFKLNSMTPIAHIKKNKMPA